jgi:hypothetical protein
VRSLAPSFIPRVNPGRCTAFDSVAAIFHVQAFIDSTAFPAKLECVQRMWQKIGKLGIFLKTGTLGGRRNKCRNQINQLIRQDSPYCQLTKRDPTHANLDTCRPGAGDQFDGLAQRLGSARAAWRSAGAARRDWRRSRCCARRSDEKHLVFYMSVR